MKQLRLSKSAMLMNRDEDQKKKKIYGLIKCQMVSSQFYLQSPIQAGMFYSPDELA